jgi:hypothetical protein
MDSQFYRQCRGHGSSLLAWIYKNFREAITLEIASKRVALSSTPMFSSIP